MNNQITTFSKAEKVLIETDEFIFPIRIEKVMYVEIKDLQTIRFYEYDSNYQLSGKKNNVYSLLKQAGFIQIQADLLINPKWVAEYKIKDYLIRLSTGKSIAVQPKYRKTLIEYFQQYYIHYQINI